MIKLLFHITASQPPFGIATLIYNRVVGSMIKPQDFKAPSSSPWGKEHYDLATTSQELTCSKKDQTESRFKTQKAYTFAVSYLLTARSTQFKGPEADII